MCLLHSRHSRRGKVYRYSEHDISGCKSPGPQQIDYKNRPRPVPVPSDSQRPEIPQHFTETVVGQQNFSSASFVLWQPIVALHQAADSVFGAHPGAEPRGAFYGSHQVSLQRRQVRIRLRPVYATSPAPVALSALPIGRRQSCPRGHSYPQHQVPAPAVRSVVQGEYW
jgi:hypothetical protein